MLAAIRERLSFKVILATVALLALVLAASSSLQILREEEDDLQATNARGKELAANVAHLASRALDEGRFTELETRLQRIMEATAGINFIRISGPGGLILAQFPREGSSDPRLLAKGLSYGAEVKRWIAEEPDPDGEEEIDPDEWEEPIESLSNPEGELIGRVLVGLSTEALRTAAGVRYTAVLLQCLTAMLAVGIVLWVFLKRRMAGPLRELGECAIELGRRQFDRPIRFKSEDEVGALADALERMRRDLVRFLTERERVEKEERELTHMKEEYVAYTVNEVTEPAHKLLKRIEAAQHSKGEAMVLARALDEAEGFAHELSLRLDQVLDFARQAGAEVGLEERTIDVTEAVEDTLDRFRHAIRSKGLELSCELERGLGLTTDRSLFDQLVCNAMDNAVRLTDEGSISISARSLGRECMALRIEDSGHGIPPELQEQLFERMQRGFRPDRHEYAGSWIGLAIAKRSVDVMGGVLQLSSTPGFGTTLTAVLPLREGVAHGELLEQLSRCDTEEIQL